MRDFIALGLLECRWEEIGSQRSASVASQVQMHGTRTRTGIEGAAPAHKGEAFAQVLRSVEEEAARGAEGAGKGRAGQGEGEGEGRRGVGVAAHPDDESAA